MKNGEGTSIHWHGLPQKNSPYMDGVSMVTQCPISEFTNFRYEFIAEHPGTHWWHAHSGMHRADGVYGALIIRESREVDKQSALFDYDLSEHVILTHDWLDQTTLDKFAAHHFDNGNNRPESVLINGKGRRQSFYNEMGQNDTVPEALYTAREVFHVKQVRS
ncbi:L-ascorbate oxidase-like [Lytechinus variegatus]|uniref:L-ascorbate oxidase-like n=1 Tax=Lytechinus variegatus TaxID=7654 RepID=UPI001BB2614A|nr:L-ascorbate oxidase-like [Lytechinus variegatus]